MSETLAQQAVDWGHRLPLADLRALARAAREGSVALAALRAETSHPEALLASAVVAKSVAAGDGTYVAGLLEGASAHLHATTDPSLEVVWTGPVSSVNSSRLTSAVIAGLLAEAEHEILLVSYASYPPLSISAAFSAAAARGVRILLLAERPADRPGFNGLDVPLPGIECTRLHWPADVREPGASLHAKILVVDRKTALVGSANFTGHGMERNLECGLLIRGGAVPGSIREHLLTADGVVPLGG